MCFWLNLIFFTSPYFDHDAFMHHALHVLDIPGHNVITIKFQIASSKAVAFKR